MDFGPNNWYPEPVPMWNLQTPTIFIPPSPTLVNPPLSPPPHFSSHSIPPFQSPSIPAFIPNPAAVQSCIAAFAALQPSMDECNTTFREDMQKIQERLQQSHRLIHERRSLLQELRSKVPTAATTPSSGPRYASEDPTLPSPWKGLIDGSTGSLYYWNTATNQTQYERPCPQAQITHPTQPIYLRRKQLRGLRRRVSMAATRRLVKDTRKPDLLSRVGKYSGSKLNCKHGLWAIKAQNGEAFSDIMEAIRQHCVVTETSTTNPCFSPLISEVTEQHAVLFSVAVADEVSLPSTKPTSDDAVVPNGATTGASLACAHELDPDLICLNPLPSVTKYDPSQLSIESGQAEVPTPDSCFSSFTPGPDVVVDVSSAATAIGSKLADMVEPLKLETVAKCGFGLAGFISITENYCPDSAMVQLIAMTTELNNKEFALVYHSCKLGNFSQARRVLCVKFSLDSTMITDASFLCGYICEEQLFAGDKYGHMLVNAAMGATTQPSLSQVSLTPHFNYQDVRRVLVSFLSGVIKPSTYGPLHSKVGEETWLLDDRIEKMNGDADTLFASQSPRKLTLDCFLVATDLASQMVPLEGSEMVNKRVNMPMVIVSSLSWLAILLSKVIRMETDERNRPLTHRWLNCCLFLWDCKLNVATLAALAGTMHAWLNGTLNCLPLVEGVTKLDIMDKDTAARIPSPKNADSYKCAQFSADGRFLLSSSFERFVEVVETLRKGPQFSVKVLAVFINRQPITLLQWVYLRTLDHATLPNALCFAPTCTDLVQLLTHRAMTSILLQLHSYLQELGLRTHMDVLDYLFMTSWAYIVRALPLRVTTTCMADITRDNPSLSAVVVCPVPCQCQPRWSFVDKVIASVNNISELSFMRYYYAPLLPSDYGVFPMTYMNMCFQYMVSHVHQDMFFMVTHSSVFYSPFYALVKKLFLLSPMTAIQLLGSLLAHILRDDDRYIIGILVLNSIIQVVSLKSTQHGIAIRYGAILTGNYCSHVRCLIYSPEFMNTWIIQFGFVTIDFGYPVLIPSLHFSLPMRSIEGLMLLLLPTIINCQLMELVVSSTLLQSSNGDTLRVLRVFSHTLLLTNSQASAHLWVHHYVFKGCICLLKLRMELPYMPHIVVAILSIGIIQPLSDFKAVAIFLLPDFIVIWIDITVGDRLWGTVAKHDTMIEFRTTITAFGTTRTSPVSGTPRRHTNSMAYMFSLATMESNDDFAASAKQGRSRVFMQLKSYFYELLALVPALMKSSSSFYYSHHFISQALSHYVQSFHSTLFVVLLLLVAYVDSRSPDKLGSEENMVSVDVTEASQNVNDSVDEGVLQGLEELLVTPLLESVAQMVIVFKKSTCGALLSSYAASDKLFEGIISTVMVENDPVVKVIYVDSSIKGAYLPLSCYDETVFAYPKTNAAEDHHLLVQFFFYLGDLYTRTEKIRESLSYHPTTLQIYVKSLPGTAPASRASNLTDTAATYESVNELEQTVNLSQPCTMLKLEDKLVLKGGGLVRITPT